jgi:hypothetical protein
MNKKNIYILFLEYFFLKILYKGSYPTLCFKLIALLSLMIQGGCHLPKKSPQKAYTDAMKDDILINPHPRYLLPARYIFINKPSNDSKKLAVSYRTRGRIDYEYAPNDMTVDKDRMVGIS